MFYIWGNWCNNIYIYIKILWSTWDKSWVVEKLSQIRFCKGDFRGVVTFHFHRSLHSVQSVSDEPGVGRGHGLPCGRSMALFDCVSFHCCLPCSNWLVVLTILKNISQWEGLSHILWKIKNVPNHQPACDLRYLTKQSPIPSFNFRRLRCSLMASIRRCSADQFVWINIKQWLKHTLKPPIFVRLDGHSFMSNLHRWPH